MGNKVAQVAVLCVKKGSEYLQKAFLVYIFVLVIFDTRYTLIP